MEEYVNKKEVLELIRRWWKTTVYVSKEPVVIKAINELPTIKADDGCCPECGANLEKVESEGEWIPVNEKRPVGFEKVLVTYRLHYDNSIHVGIGNIITNDVNGRYHWNINEQDYIGWDMLAWMPLPEPYKAESEG